MKRLFGILLSAALLSGCTTPYAQNYTPSVDLGGVDPVAYQSDLAECRTYAANHDPAQAMANSAIAGAIFGALLGAAVGGGRAVSYGAGVGAVEAGGAGGLSAVEQTHLVVKRCLAGRGYRVLD